MGRPLLNDTRYARAMRRLLFVVAFVACGPSGGGDDAGGTDAASDTTKPSDAAPDAPPVKCTPGDIRCTDDKGGTQTCDESGDWVAALTCTNQTCVSGKCAGVCGPGQTQCSGNGVQSCDGTGNWGTATACPDTCCGNACVDTKTDTNHCGSCGNVCGGGTTCGTSFTAFTGTQSANWTNNGSANYDTGDSAALLTDTNNGEAGTWVYNHAIYVDDVVVQFDFYVGGGNGADGLAMMFETNGANALGTLGGGLGVAGLSGFGVEMDYYNNSECGDASANHMAIDSLTTCGDGPPTTLAENDSPGFTIADGNWHTVIVHVVNGAFTVTADGNSEFSAYSASGWSNGNYYLGFGGGTGGLNNNQLVRNVSVKFAGGHCY
jgi:hypothetical protein